MSNRQSKKCSIVRLSAILCFLGLPSTGKAEVPSFHLDVMPILSKSGCNLGTCHGNARGKGGFQLSLRGQDPDADFTILTRDLFGRRANGNVPEQSLILLKPTMELAHEGGKRFTSDSPEYRILREWIAAGMPNDSIGYRQFIQLRVSPSELFLPAGKSELAQKNTEGWQVQIQATAVFSDGSTRDITSLAVYEVSQPIADVSHNGHVEGHAAGETTVLVRYLNQQAAVRLAFLPQRPGFVWSAPQSVNVVDEHVFAKLEKLQINPSPVCDDATFVRRVTLDLTGLPPTADEARQFVADRSPDKRRILIDELLDRPEFSDWWALKWADLLRIEEKTLDRKGVENFHSWLRDAFLHGKPLDQFVREIVAGRGSTYEVPPANFYRALRSPFERSEAVGQLFLGVRLQCTKCHNHPFDQWTQDDYYSWGSVFARVDYKILENRRRDSNDKHEFDGEQIVYVNESGQATDPRTGKPRSSRFLGNEAAVEPTSDPLIEVADWLTNAGNTRFVQMLANRTWQQVMGRGIVDPIDDFRATNPPSNPALLEALAKELAVGPPAGRTVGDSNSTIRIGAVTNRPDGAFDLRHLLRVILNSHTYQLMSDSNESNRDDETNFSRALVRRHPAELILDATSQILNVPLEFSQYPKGRRASQLPGVPMFRPGDQRSTEEDRFLRLFGRPPRLQSCDCERSEETTLGQTFQLVSGPLINRMLSSPGNRLDRLIAANLPANELVEDLYWMTLTRAPSADELTSSVNLLESTKNRRATLEDITWALFNSNEFLLRH